MKNNRRIVIANWKANPETLKEAKQIFQSIKKNNSKLRNIDIVVCPSYIHLNELKKLKGSSSVSLGSQDFFEAPSGAFTGYVGYESLLDASIKYAIIGHSERRALGETNEIISSKILAALAQNICPIVCVGESQRDENLDYLNFLKEQLIEAFYNVPKQKVSKIIVAYEPIWAIGKSAKRNASPDEIKEISIFIKRVVGDLYKSKSLPPIKIVYGGSVNTKNVEDILKGAGVDGLLVGGASLKTKDFAEILKISDSLK